MSGLPCHSSYGIVTTCLTSLHDLVGHNIRYASAKTCYCRVMRADYLINLFFLYNYSLRLETGLFSGRPADYLFMLIFNWICCVIIGLLAEFPVKF